MTTLFYRKSFSRRRINSYRPQSFYISFDPSKGNDFDIEQSLFWGGVITTSGGATLKPKGSASKRRVIVKAGGAKIRLFNGGTANLVIPKAGTARAKLRCTGIGDQVVGKTGNAVLVFRGLGVNIIDKSGLAIALLIASGFANLVISKSGNAVLRFLGYETFSPSETIAAQVELVEETLFVIEIEDSLVFKSDVAVEPH